MKNCSVENCDNNVFCKGYCKKHYHRLYRYNNPNEYKRAEQDRLTLKYPVEYRTLQSMKQRCYNPKYPAYKNYGGRGIKVCERWLDIKNGFKNFLEDMGEKPKGLSIDRINNNGNYEPNNCRWADVYTQLKNRRKYKIYREKESL